MNPAYIKLIVAGMGFLMASAVAAKDKPPDFYFMHGKCVHLTVNDRDQTGSCKNVLINSVWTEKGRTGFYSIPEGDSKADAVTFSSNREVPQGEDARLLSVDLLIIGGHGFPAVGTCHYENPFKGKATVSCSAEAGATKSSGEFVTDGSPPTH